MKVLSVGLCLALISIVSCQHPLPPKAVKERTAAMPLYKTWYLNVDKNYYKIYNAFRDLNVKAFQPFFAIQNDLMNQYENLNCSLGGYVPSGLQNFVLSLNSSLDMYTVYTYYYGMQYFMGGMAGELSHPARQLRQTIENGLNQILPYVSTPLPPTAPGIQEFVSDACTTQLFQELRNLIEPIATGLVTNGTNMIALIPDLRAYLVSLVNDAKLEVEAVTKKMQFCNQIQKIDEKNTCATNMEIYYTSNNNFAQNLVVNTLNSIQSQFSMFTQPLFYGENAVYDIYGIYYSQDIYTKITNLKNLCT